MNAVSRGRVGAPSTTIVEMVADRDGVDPLRIEPLYETIDPEALDALVGPDSGSPHAPVEITFEYCEYHVVVASDGTVEIGTDS